MRTKNIRRYSPQTIQNQERGKLLPEPTHRKVILINNCTELPMPNEVVDAIHRLAAASKQAGGINFTN